MSELKIGCLVPLTGIYSPWGEAFAKGWRMQIEQINAQGGINLGQERLPINLVLKDDGSAPDVARKAAGKLIFHDKVKFLLGAISGDVLLAAQELTEPIEVLFLCVSYIEGALSPKNPFTLRPLISTERYPCMWKWIAQTYAEIKRVAILGPNDKVGKNLVSVSEKTAVKQGFQISIEKFYNHGTTDFVPLLRDVLKTNPDDIDFAGSPTTEVGLIVNQARKMDFKGLMTTISGHSSKLLSQIAGKKNIEGFIHSTMIYDGPLVTPRMIEYKKNYITRWKTFDEQAGRGVDYIPILINGIEKSQSLEPRCVRDSILSMKYTFEEGTSGYWGGAKKYGIGHQYYSKIYICKIHNGADVAVAYVMCDESDWV